MKSMAKRIIELKYYKNPDTFLTYRPVFVAETWEKKQGLQVAMKAKTISDFEIILEQELTVGMVRVIEFKK